MGERRVETYKSCGVEALQASLYPKVDSYNRAQKKKKYQTRENWPAHQPHQ